MNSFIITGGTLEERILQADAITAEQHIDPVAITRIEKQEDEKKTKQSIGIDEIKQMQKQLFLTPAKGEKKAIVIPRAELLTTEAQNALLKVLEEPPTHAIFILLSTTPDELLPTIQSRCKIITFQKVEKHLTPDEKKEYSQIFDQLIKHSVEHPLLLAEEWGKDRESALKRLGDFLLLSSEYAIETNTILELAPIMTACWDAYKTIKSTNANPRLVLESFFLNFITE